jgi:phosphopantothenoylcysteine decarboxylase/phosphopantothenate--cysteine ligase
MDSPVPGEFSGHPPKRLVVGVSGSVAVLGLPVYLQAFRAAGVENLVAVLTPAAEKFLPAATLRLICDAVYTEEEPGQGHVALGRWADQVLVLPATAHLLGCMANGLAPSLLTTTLLAVPGPVVVVPAMNRVMWHRAPVQRNVDRLRADGHLIVDPVPGKAYEVASRGIRDSLVIPAPEEIISVLSRQSTMELTGASS